MKEIVEEVQEIEEQEMPLFRAKRVRNEIDGHLYQVGDLTNLDGLTIEEKAHVVCKGYYAVINFAALSDELIEEINNQQGG